MIRLTTTKTVCELLNIEHACKQSSALAPMLNNIEIHFHIFSNSTFSEKAWALARFLLFMRFFFHLFSIALVAAVLIAFAFHVTWPYMYCWSIFRLSIRRNTHSIRTPYSVHSTLWSSDIWGFYIILSVNEFYANPFPNEIWYHWCCSAFSFSYSSSFFIPRSSLACDFWHIFLYFLISLNVCFKARMAEGEKKNEILFHFPKWICKRDKVLNYEQMDANQLQPQRITNELPID